MLVYHAPASDSGGMDVISLVGIVAALFIVISLSEPLADWVVGAI